MIRKPHEKYENAGLQWVSVNFVSKIVKEIDHSKYLKVVLYKTGQQQWQN